MIAGHSRNIRYFERVLANGTLAHAYLFHGPAAVGKRAIAMAVAETLLCSGGRDKTLGGCGGCEDCRLVASGTHPDLIFLSFEHLLVEEDLKRGIGIKNIHELQRLLALAPWRGGRKVVLIDGADALSREAQTALLKTLEEPQSRIVFFLITDRPSALLPTIHSRSVFLGFTPVADGEIMPLITAVPPARGKLILAFAAGRPGLALRLAREEYFFNAFREREEEFIKVLNADLSDQLLFSEDAGSVKGRTSDRAAFGRAEKTPTDASHEPVALEDFFEWLIHRERSELFSALAAAGATGERVRFIHSLLDRLSLIESTTVNRRLVADSIFVELATRPL